MLQSLDQLKQKQQQTARASFAGTLSAFANAASNEEAAQDFYLQAEAATQFAGQSQTAFQNWRKREIGRMNPSAIRACLRYTVISLQKAGGATDQQISGELLTYAQETQQNLPVIGGDPIMHQPITGNLFARWYNLSDQLSSLDNWAMEPGDIDGIYEKVLLPMMRKYRDPRILQYWNAKIAAESTAATASTNAFNVNQFNQNRLPELLWSRAEDMVTIGARDQGLSTMYSIVKNYPTHQSAGKWIDELKSLLTNPAGTPGSAGETTGTAPAPAPPPPAQ